MNGTARRLLCLVALFAASTIIGNADGFQHQTLQSERNPFRSASSSAYTAKSKSTAIVVPPSSSSTSASTSSTQLNAIPALSSSPLGALAVLAGIVVVHEAGHYLAARSFNITVEEFSVGFGPKLTGFQAFGNEFNLRALPLGGFVRFPENFDGEAVLEIEELKRKARRTLRRERTDWNFKDEALDAATLGYWSERNIDEKRKEKQLEREEVAKEAKKGFGAFFSFFSGGRQQKKKAIVDGEVDIDEIYENLDELENYEIEYYDDPQLLQNRPWPERALVLSGGVIFNLLLALSIYFAAIGPLPVGSSQGLPRPVFDDGVMVTQAPRPDGPSSGLLRKGDIITGINGKCSISISNGFQIDGSTNALSLSFMDY